MDAEKLTAALAAAKTSSDVRSMLPAFDERRQAIRQRLAEIAMPIGDALQPGPARAAALREGPVAMVRLDAERDLLEAELTILHRGERAAIERLRELERVEALAALPAARKRLPARIAAVRDALARLDEALESLRTDVHLVAAAIEHCGEFPLTDGELAAVLELREVGWKPRLWPCLIPPTDRRYAKSIALYYTGETPLYRARTSHADSQADVRKITDDPEPRAARPRPVRRLLERLGGRS
jgi:hypothetical protein